MEARAMISGHGNTESTGQSRCWLQALTAIWWVRGTASGMSRLANGA